MRTACAGRLAAPGAHAKIGPVRYIDHRRGRGRRHDRRVPALAGHEVALVARACTWPAMRDGGLPLRPSTPLGTDTVKALAIGGPAGDRPQPGWTCWSWW